MDDFFTPPPFKADEALQNLKRSLRGLALTEQGQGFAWQGKRIAELVLADNTILARLARRPAMQPEFDTLSLKTSADTRKLIDELKQRLARWSEE